MALPMRKEDAERVPPERARPRPEWQVEMLEIADKLRKELGRPLKTEFGRPTTEEEWQETVIASVEKDILEEDPNAPPPTMTTEEELRAEGLLPLEKERENIQAELRAEGLLPPEEEWEKMKAKFRAERLSRISPVGG